MANYNGSVALLPALGVLAAKNDGAAVAEKALDTFGADNAGVVAGAKATCALDRYAGATIWYRRMPPLYGGTRAG